MKASELIKALEKGIEEFGDLDTKIEDSHLGAVSVEGLILCQSHYRTGETDLWIEIF